MGFWGYFDSDIRPITALIPVIFGLILIFINGGVKKENKLISHIAVILTFLILIGLLKPLFSSINKGDSLPLGRVLLMFSTSLLSMIFFIKSFIKARKFKS
tara:strand:- start:793 stop:1095 length:303 start_codon:yes stop_codon:yes gene_type:complete